MLLDRKLIHPSILSAYDAYRSDGGVHQNNSLAQVVSVFLGVSLGWFLFRQGAGIVLALLPGLSVSALGWLAFRGSRSKHQLDVEASDLGKVFEQLDAEESWQAYVKALVALSQLYQKSQVEETIQALNMLLDEEANLHRAKVELANIQNGRGFEKIDSERRAVLMRLEAATDPVAREVLTQSLALIGERQAGQQRYKEHLERLMAHLVLIRQTILAAQDAALRVQALPSGMATDSLRLVVSQARAQTLATENAIAELNAI